MRATIESNYGNDYIKVMELPMGIYTMATIEPNIVKETPRA